VRFGTDGLRGRYGSELTEDIAFRLGAAVAEVIEVGHFVVGGDSRESTPSLERALVAGLGRSGARVERLGLAPTPLVAHRAAQTGASALVVSASHNPFHDNGIKVFGPGGAKLDPDTESAIEALLNRAASTESASETPEGPDEAVVSAYVGHLNSIIDGRSLAGPRVVVDAANGAASRLAGDALRALGVDLEVIADQPDGRNINSGCGATHPGMLADTVRQRGADLGFALDGDADRVMAVDATGRILDGDHIMAMLALDLRARGALSGDTLVVTVMSNLGLRQAMEAEGIAIIETPVGDRHVAEALRVGGHSLGGEQSGHIILADHAPSGDGLATSVALLDLIIRSGRTLADLARAAMTALPQTLLNVEVDPAGPSASTLVNEVAATIAEVERRLAGSGRVLVRPSGTEPLVRVMVEAPTSEIAESSAGTIAEAIRNYSAPG
jgi:phosphoglucosamine mutase